jgi:hypothetical protein
MFGWSRGGGPTPTADQLCEDLGVSWTRPGFEHLSVARAEDAAELDTIIGPKR